MANFVTVNTFEVVCKWVCMEEGCREDAFVNPDFHEESGNPMCPECDVEMEFDSVLVDDRLLRDFPINKKFG